MAFRKTLAKIYSQIRAPVAATASSAALRRRMLPESNMEDGLLRRILQRRPIFQAAVPPDRWLPTGDRLIERIRGLNRDRIRFDCLAPPPMSAEEEAKGRVSLEEVKKVLRASQMEAVRARLREIPSSSIPHSDFLDICCEASGSQQGIGIAKALDESGAVIVLGNVVFLRPDQELIHRCSTRRPKPRRFPDYPPRMDPHRLHNSLRELAGEPPPAPGPELRQVAEASKKEEEPPIAQPVSRKRIREDAVGEYKRSILFRMDIRRAVELYQISDENLARECEIASRAVSEFKESDEFQDLVYMEEQKGVAKGFKIFQDISRRHPKLDLTSLEFKDALQYLPPSISTEDTD